MMKKMNDSALPNWDSIIFDHDDTFGDDITKKVIGSISPSREKPNTNYVKIMLDETAKLRDNNTKYNNNNNDSNTTINNNNNDNNNNSLSMSIDRNDSMFLCRGKNCPIIIITIIIIIIIIIITYYDYYYYHYYHYYYHYYYYYYYYYY